MNTNTFPASATALVASFGNTAHQAIDAYRAGGKSLGRKLEHRWKAALKQSSPQLTPETIQNAARAQRAFSGYCARGLALSADGAEVVVDTLVGATVAAIDRAAELAAHARANKVS